MVMIIMMKNQNNNVESYDEEEYWDEEEYDMVCHGMV